MTATPAPVRLRRSFSWTLAGNVVYAGCQWGVLVLLARVFPMEDVGRYGLALAVSTPLFLLAGCKLRSVVATDLRGEYQFAEYLGLRLVAVAAALILTPGLALALGFDQRTALLSLAVAATKAIDSITDVFHGLLQRHERQDQISVNLTLNGGVTLAAMGAVTVLTGSLPAGVMASAAVSMLALADAVRRVRAVGAREPGGLCPRWRFQRLTFLARMTAPLGAGVMLSSLSLHAPRYVVGRFGGMREVAVLAALSSVAVMASMVINALGQAATPRLAQFHARGDAKGFERLLAKLLQLGTVLGAGGLVVALAAGRPILGLLYGAEYAAHADLLVIIMLATGVTYACVFLGTALSAMRAFTVQLPINVASFAVLMTASLVLVRTYGTHGVAAAMVLAAGTEGALLFRAFRRHRRVHRLALEPA